MLDLFKKNIIIEKQIINSIKNERDPSILQSYVNQIKILNYAIPELLKTTSPAKTISHNPPDLVSIHYSKESGIVYVRSADLSEFKSQLAVVQRNQEKTAKTDIKTYANVRPSFIRNISNRLFRNTAEGLLPSFGSLSKNIKRANLSVLPSTYLAMALFFTLLSFFVGIIIYAGLLYINLGYWTYFWVIFGVPSIVFFMFYYYPSSEANSVEKAISYELPFVTIHMTAIAGSDLEPTKIFQIIANSKEYPIIGREMQKILVLIRVYGYDLVTSLKNVSKRTSNERLAELLSGLATNIIGGGGLKEYLERKADNFLLDYQLERRKYIDVASTFMDIYISILIAAPMVLMLMFIIMNVAGLGFEGYSIQFLLMISIFVIILVNILFIVMLNLKQPKV